MIFLIYLSFTDLGGVIVVVRSPIVGNYCHGLYKGIGDRTHPEKIRETLDVLKELESTKRLL